MFNAAATRGHVREGLRARRYFRLSFIAGDLVTSLTTGAASFSGVIARTLLAFLPVRLSDMLSSGPAVTRCRARLAGMRGRVLSHLALTPLCGLPQRIAMSRISIRWVVIGETGKAPSPLDTLEQFREGVRG